jgi:hypothetical protein
MHPRLILPVALILAACSAKSDPAATRTTQTVRVVAGAGATTQLTTTRAAAGGVTGTFDMDFSRAWQVLPSVYEELGIPVTDRRVDVRSLGNSGFKVRRRLEGVPLTRYLDCGRAQGAPSAETYEIMLAVHTQLSAADDGRTTVSTLVDAMARPVNFAGEYSGCSSTGVLEQSIIDLLYRATIRP